MEQKNYADQGGRNPPERQVGGREDNPVNEEEQIVQCKKCKANATPQEQTLPALPVTPQKQHISPYSNL